MDPSLSDADAVRAANTAFYRAFEACDIETMAALWSSVAQVTCIHPGWQPAVGRDAVMSSWLTIFQNTTAVQFTLRNAQIFVAGDAAWVLVLEELSLTQSDGQQIHAALQATNVFVRELDGWKVAHHHAGPAGVAQPYGGSRVLH